jgi:hypothetical protein
MNITTRAERMQIAHQLREAARRRASDNPQPGGPIGDCGRTEGETCGMIDPSECRTHAEPDDDDPELLSFAGTLSQRREQLRAARRHGLQR